MIKDARPRILLEVKETFIEKIVHNTKNITMDYVFEKGRRLEGIHYGLGTHILINEKEVTLITVSRYHLRNNFTIIEDPYENNRAKYNKLEVKNEHV